MFQTQTKIRLHHTDSAGVLYFAQLFVLAHECYEAFMDTVLPIRTILDQGQILMPITHAEADYQNPIRVGDSLDVTLTLGSITEHSFTLNYSFKKHEIQVATASIRNVVVCADFTGKSKIPPELRKALKAISPSR